MFFGGWGTDDSISIGTRYVTGPGRQSSSGPTRVKFMYPRFLVEGVMAAGNLRNSLANARTGSLLLTLVATGGAFVMALLRGHLVAQIFFAAVSLVVLVLILRIFQRSLALSP